MGLPHPNPGGRGICPGMPGGVWGGPGLPPPKVHAASWEPRIFPSQDYYGTVLQKSADLQTNACVTRPQPLSAAVRAALESVHEDVASR